MIRQSTEEDAINRQLLSTAAILSSGKLTGNYGLQINAVDCIEVQGEEDDFEESEKKLKGTKTKKLGPEEELQKLKLREHDLLKEAFKSLEIYQL